MQVMVAQKVTAGVYKGVTTTELDELAAETAASLTATHPDYALVSNIHANIIFTLQSPLTPISHFYFLIPFVNCSSLPALLYPTSTRTPSSLSAKRTFYKPRIHQPYQLLYNFLNHYITN
jgi:hypothetical protein